MRKKEKEITDKKAIEELLARGEVLHLGMWDGASPYVVPLNYAYGNGAIYFHSSRKGKKAETLAAHPEVCFEVTVEAEVVREPKPCGFTTRFASVIGYGRAVAVEEPGEKQRALTLLMAHYGSDKTDFPRVIVDKTLVVRIDVASMTGKQSPAPAKDEPEGAS